MLDAEEAGKYIFFGLLIAAGIVGYWFLTYFIIAPAIIQAFGLDASVWSVTWIVFLGGDAGIFGLAIWGKRRA